MKVSALGLLALLGIASLVPTAATQPAAKQVTLGILYPAGAEPWPAFITALRDLGYQQDRNLKIEYRSANGHNEELPRLAAELVSLKPDVIVAGLRHRYLH
jgi:putative ABC transport system substrate-binding protein